MKCFNCNEKGHLANFCPKSRVERGVCFGCRQPGHAARDCPVRRVGLATFADVVQAAPPCEWYQDVKDNNIDGELDVNC